VQAEFRKLIREIGRRGFLENNACMGFYLHGISHSYGEEMDLHSPAYADQANAAAIASGFTGAIHGNPLADAIMDCWTKRMAWWAEAAGSHIGKVAFVNAGNMPGKPYQQDKLAAFSLALGLGERHGNIEEYFYGDVLPDKQGQSYVPGGYVETDWDHPLRRGRYWGDENEQMNHYRMPDGSQPSDEVRALCYRSSFFRAAQLGMNFLWTDAGFVNAAGNADRANVADGDDFLPAWFTLVAGKGPELSPDAICWLRQAWVRLLPSAGNEARPWNNLERLLLQRDIPAAGPVIGAMTVPDLAMDFPYVSVKRRDAPDGPPETSDNEYTARRTDLASGNPHVAFKLHPAFKDSIVRQNQAVQIRVHYLHHRNASFTVRVARGGMNFIDLGSVSGVSPDHGWKTATFTLHPADFPVPGDLLGPGIDFVVRAEGPENLTVRYVRVVRTAEIPLAPVVRGHPQSKTTAAGTAARFWVQAEGPGTLAYRWRKGGKELSDGPKYAGTATAALTIIGVTATDEGEYDVVVSNRVGSTRETISHQAMLTLGAGNSDRVADVQPDGWRPLLDQELSRWEKFIGVPHGSLGLPGLPPESDGMKGTPLGLDHDPLGVFTVVKEEGEPVLRVSGQIYGGLTTKDSFADYHLRLQFRWGDKKWAPRLTQRRDSGILYHAAGPHGAFWNVWKRSIEFQVEETNMGDLYALAGTSAEVPVLPQGRIWRYDPAGRMEKIITADGVPMFTARHRPGAFERPGGGWNTLELIVRGRNAVHVVNGRVVLVARNLAVRGEDGSESPLTRGQIQLQSEGAEAFYRRVELRTITGVPPEYRDQIPADIR
jgi:hypothetical protein